MSIEVQGHFLTLPKVVYIQKFKLDFLRNYCADLEYKIQDKIQETLFNLGYSKTVNISYKLFSDKHEYKKNSKYLNQTLYESFQVQGNENLIT